MELGSIFVFPLVALVVAVFCCYAPLVTLQVMYAQKARRACWSQRRPGALREAVAVELAYRSRAALPQLAGASKVFFISHCTTGCADDELVRRCRAAAAAAVLRHPALRTCHVTVDDTNGYIRSISVDAATACLQGAIALTRADDVKAAAMNECTMQANSAFELDIIDGVAVQRSFQVHIIAASAGPAASRNCAVVLTLHHAVCDGTSGLYLLADIMRHISGTAVPFERCDDLPLPLPDRVLQQHWPCSPTPWLRGLYVLWQEVTIKRYAVLSMPAVTPPVPAGAASEAQNAAWRTVTIPVVQSLTPADTRALREACRRHGVTVNAALHAALVMAANDRCGASRHPILIRTSVDARRRITPSISPSDLFFCATNASSWHARPVVEDRSAATFWRIAQQDAASMQSWMTSMLQCALGWLLIQEVLLKVLLSRTATLASPPPATVLTSNCGDVSHAFQGTGTNEVLFFSSINAWRTLEVTAATVADACIFVFSCPVVLLHDSTLPAPPGVVALRVERDEMAVQSAAELLPLATPYRPLIKDVMGTLRSMALL